MSRRGRKKREQERQVAPQDQKRQQPIALESLIPEVKIRSLGNSLSKAAIVSRWYHWAAWRGVVRTANNNVSHMSGLLSNLSTADQGAIFQNKEHKLRQELQNSLATTSKHHVAMMQSYLTKFPTSLRNGYACAWMALLALQEQQEREHRRLLLQQSDQIAEFSNLSLGNEGLKNSSKYINYLVPLICQALATCHTSCKQNSITQQQLQRAFTEVRGYLSTNKLIQGGTATIDHCSTTGGVAGEVKHGSAPGSVQAIATLYGNSTTEPEPTGNRGDGAKSGFLFPVQQLMRIYAGINIGVNALCKYRWILGSDYRSQYNTMVDEVKSVMGPARTDYTRFEKNQSDLALQFSLQKSLLNVIILLSEKFTATKFSLFEGSADAINQFHRNHLATLLTLLNTMSDASCHVKEETEKVTKKITQARALMACLAIVKSEVGQQEYGKHLSTMYQLLRPHASIAINSEARARSVTAGMWRPAVSSSSSSSSSSASVPSPVSS